jgi:hypothetical protein
LVARTVLNLPTMLSTIGLMEPTSCGGPSDILDAPCGAAALEDDALEDRRGTAVRRALFWRC